MIGARPRDLALLRAGGSPVAGALRRSESRVYSQSGEDGVIAALFELIGETNRFYVEFGAKDGVHLSNTARLRLECGWRGVLFDGDPDWACPEVHTEWITAENIEETFDRYDVPTDLDLLSMDVDGNEYWLWRALERYRPRVAVIEYNIFFDLEAVTVPYDATRTWDGTSYHGASLGALHHLARKKDYALVYTDTWAPNAFLVARECLPADFDDVPLERIARWKGIPRPPGLDDRIWVRL